MLQNWIGLAVVGFLVFVTLAFMAEWFKRKNWTGVAMAALGVVIWVAAYFFLPVNEFISGEHLYFLALWVGVVFGMIFLVIRSFKRKQWGAVIVVAIVMIITLAEQLYRSGGFSF